MFCRTRDSIAKRYLEGFSLYPRRVWVWGTSRGMRDGLRLSQFVGADTIASTKLISVDV